MTEEEQDALFNDDAVIEYIDDLVSGMTEEQRIEYDNFISDFDSQSVSYYESEEKKQELILEQVMLEIQRPSIFVDYVKQTSGECVEELLIKTIYDVDYKHLVDFLNQFDKNINAGSIQNIHYETKFSKFKNINHVYQTPSAIDYEI